MDTCAIYRQFRAGHRYGNASAKGMIWRLKATAGVTFFGVYLTMYATFVLSISMLGDVIIIELSGGSAQSGTTTGRFLSSDAVSFGCYFRKRCTNHATPKRNSEISCI